MDEAGHNFVYFEGFLSKEDFRYSLDISRFLGIIRLIMNILIIARAYEFVKIQD